MDDKSLFEKIGLKKGRLKKVLKNENLSKTLRAVINESGVDIDKSVPSVIKKLLLELGLMKKATNLPNRETISKYIASGKFTMKVQIEEAVSYCLCPDFDLSEFEEVSGAGVTLSEKEVSEKVAVYFATISKEDIIIEGNVGFFVRECKTRDPMLKFAEGKKLFGAVTKEVLSKCGISNVKELKGLVKKSTKKERSLIKSMKFQVRDIPMARNSKKMLDAHKKVTKGQIRTRFPPEPNGYLHIGHARAMIFDFGYADEHEGMCYLRYDDTNPEMESKEYIDGIKEMVMWMGFKPKKTTFSSEYFQKLFEMALKLIRKGLAYVDFSTRKEIEIQREKLEDSPYRTKYTVEENEKLFMDMKHGKFEAGKCCLRCKIDSGNLNPNMRDFVAYRVKYVSHPHIGDEWCIYPTYDFTHCLVDSLEHITHSMCTMEFETRRDSYFWLLHVLDMYKPFVWEFSRLNLTKALLSKRKINKLVDLGVVRGFDDPRLLTLIGLRRRGYTPETIKTFCLGLGASRVANSLVDISKLEQVCRLELDKTCDRIFCVMDPLKVVVVNCTKPRSYEAPNHPKVKQMGTRKMTFEKVIFIERGDFRLVDNEDYFGLAPNKVVGLRYGPNIKCVDVVKKDGRVVELRCEVDYEKKIKPKGHIHWISEGNAKRIEVRMYDHLLTVKVLTKEMDIMDVINKDSEVVKRGCMVEKCVKTKPLTRYQFERVGYFCVDIKSKELVFNSIVPLKESKAKKSL